MKRSTKEILLIAAGTAVIILIIWLLPEYWLKGLITAFFLVFGWIMWRMDK